MGELQLAQQGIRLAALPALEQEQRQVLHRGPPRLLVPLRRVIDGGLLGVVVVGSNQSINHFLFNRYLCVFAHPQQPLVLRQARRRGHAGPPKLRQRIGRRSIFGPEL